MDRQKTIQSALEEVYGKSWMTKGCAEEIARKYNRWLAGEGDARRGGVLYAVHMVIWNWFPGGGTAEIAAGKVIAAVEAMP